MAVINTGLNVAGLKSEFFQHFDATPVIFDDLVTRIKSDKDKETYGFMGSVPPVREWGTGRLARGLFTEKYTVENLKYESTLEIDGDEISDDQTGQIKIRIREFAERARTHPDALLANLLINGDQSGFNAYGGVPFFSATHASGKSGTQSNKIGASAATATDPTSAEIRTALGLALSRLLELKDDQAEPLNNSASGLVMVIPPNMLIAAMEALNTTLVNNTTNVLQGAAKVVAFPRLNLASQWFLLKTDVSVRPFIFQDREPIEFTALESTSDEGFLREKFFYGVRARYAMSFGYWQRALQVDFS